jgi:ABC-2 type transport system ATP-binding protein
MTLVVSSHILAELEDYSDRMIIVDQGRIAGGEAISLRDAAKTRLRITLAAPHQELKDFLAGQPGVEILESAEAGALLSLQGGAMERAALLAALVRQGFAVSAFGEDASNLEDVYFARVRGGRT